MVCNFEGGGGAHTISSGPIADKTPLLQDRIQMGCYWGSNYLISVHFQWEAGMSPAFIGGGWTNYAGIPCNHPITKSHYVQCFFFETTVDALYACSQLYRYLLEQ